MIKKLLVSNRGEIAVRILRAAREMKIQTIAVYSEADANSLHAKMADEAYYLGPSEATQSYLRADLILEIASQCRVDAIHPGYGFLSENAGFSDQCAEMGIKFIGPPASAMRTLGSKIEAKMLAEKAGVPLVPGMYKPGASSEELFQAAKSIGFPVMLKASAGGGGRGMRVVDRESDFMSEFTVASDEALRGFGDGAMMVEKYIERPRHVEVQVLADHHGNVVALFERDCSAQRRHQKLIEESPSPAMTPELWNKMKSASVALANEAGYVGAGTFEYIVEDSTGEFYFLEVNARLQVEHPVTEVVTGIDLVKWQIRIANGDSIETLKDIRSHGHAIEARIVAENPAASFAPSIGRIVAWSEPQMPGIRVDTGYFAGSEISRYYDSLIAKVIAYGETREEATQKLVVALKDFHIVGVRTNIEFLIDLLESPAFTSGEIDTGFIGRELDAWAPQDSFPAEIANLMQYSGETTQASSLSSHTSSAWALADDWRVASQKEIKSSAH